MAEYESLSKDEETGTGTGESEYQTTVNLPADIYGLAISVATSDLPMLFEDPENLVFHLGRLIFGLVSLAVNLWLQLMIVAKVNEFIVTRAVHNTQENYLRYHAEVFDSFGAFQPDIWETWDGPKADLCGMALSKIRFTSCMIFLWTVRMLNEVTSCLQLTHDLFMVPNNPKPSKRARNVVQINERNEVDSIDIQFIGQPVRACLLVLVTLPKLLVAGTLLLGGCRWFAATESWEDLILNALALEFVIAIDELMLEAFTPFLTKQSIEKSQLVHIFEDGMPVKSEEEKIMIMGGKILQLVLCMVWAYVYTAYFQQVIPGFPHDIHIPCADWLERHGEPRCEPFGNSAECFPYGQ